MKRLITLLICFLCIILCLLIFNNYRIDRKITCDVSKVINNKGYEKAIELMDFPINSQLYEYSCGPATMSMVYSYLEETKPEQKILKELNLESRKKGMLPNTFLKYIRLSLEGYDISLKNNITDDEVLKLIYTQLEKGIPIPAYFSTVNDWQKTNYDTHYSAVIGIDMKKNKIIIANAYGFKEEVKIEDFLDSLKYKNYKKKPIYLTLSNLLGIIKKNNIYIIKERL